MNEMTTQQKARIPFSEGAKFRYVEDKILSDKLTGFSSGGQTTMALRKVGLTMGLLVTLEMDVVIASGAPVLGEEGLYGLINRIQVILGNNQAQPIDLNAAGLRHVQRLLGFQQWAGFDTPSVGKVVANPSMYAAPLAASPAVNKWVFTFLVPFSCNLHTDRHIGVLPTSARGFTANLQIDYEKIATAVTGGVLTITNSKATVDELTLDVPNFNQVQQPTMWIFARRSTTYGNVIPGDQKIEVPQGGVLLTLGGIVKANGVRTNKVNQVGVVLAGNDQPFTQSLVANQKNYQMRNRIDLPTGEFVFNFLEGSNEGFSGSYRDTIDTTALGLIETLVNVDATADLSTNPGLNSITIVRTTQHPINVAI